MGTDRPDGFIVRYTVEVVFDTNRAHSGYDRVGLIIRCADCGADLPDPGLLTEHARTHTPKEL